MSEVRNVRNGIIISGAAGIFFLMIIISFFTLDLPFEMMMILLPLVLFIFIPGFFFLYKGFPLKYRGLLLFIIGIIFDIPSIITIVVQNDDFFTMFHMYVIVFLALIFMVPAIFHIYLEFYKEDLSRVKKRLLYLFFYGCIVGLAFLTSLCLFWFGFAPQDYIIRKFWSIIGASFLIGAMFTCVIITYFFLSLSNMARTLIQIITGILGVIMGTISSVLILQIILTP